MTPPVDLPLTSLHSTNWGGGWRGGVTGGVTGGLGSAKSSVYQGFRHPTGGVGIFMQNVHKNPRRHSLQSLPGLNGTLGRTKPMT